MPTFILTFGFTDQGIRTIEDTQRRRNSAKKHAAMLGITIKDIYLTLGDSDLMYILDCPDGESAAKFALLVGTQGNVRTRTVMAFNEAESLQLIGAVSELKKKP